MLVVTRRQGEKIWIGPDICISVEMLGSVAERVRIGIDAPPGVGVGREEVVEERMRLNNETRAQALDAIARANRRRIDERTERERPAGGAGAGDGVGSVGGVAWRDTEGSAE